MIPVAPGHYPTLTQFNTPWDFYIQDNFLPQDVLDLLLKLKDIDEASKTAKVVLTNSKYMRNTWFYSSASGIHLDKNFIDLLPGTNEFLLHFQDKPALEQLGVKWM